MGLKLDIKTGILTIDEKYEIKPLMTLEELQNSNLVELMDEESKKELSEGDGTMLMIRTKYNEDEAIISLLCYKKLTRVEITVDPAGSSEAYHTDNQDKLWEVVGKNSDLMVELLKDAEGERDFKWGALRQQGGGRDYNVCIEISYYRPHSGIDYNF